MFLSRSVFSSNLHISAKICKSRADLHISAKSCKNPGDLHRFSKIETLGRLFGDKTNAEDLSYQAVESQHILFQKF